MSVARLLVSRPSVMFRCAKCVCTFLFARHSLIFLCAQMDGLSVLGAFNFSGSDSLPRFFLQDLGRLCRLQFGLLCGQELNSVHCSSHAICTEQRRIAVKK